MRALPCKVFGYSRTFDINERPEKYLDTLTGNVFMRPSMAVHDQRTGESLRCSAQLPTVAEQVMCLTDRILMKFDETDLKRGGWVGAQIWHSGGVGGFFHGGFPRFGRKIIVHEVQGNPVAGGRGVSTPSSGARRFCAVPAQG